MSNSRKLTSIGVTNDNQLMRRTVLSVVVSESRKQCNLFAALRNEISTWLSHLSALQAFVASEQDFHCKASGSKFLWVIVIHLKAHWRFRLTRLATKLEEFEYFVRNLKYFCVSWVHSHLVGAFLAKAFIAKYHRRGQNCSTDVSRVETENLSKQFLKTRSTERRAAQHLFCLF